MLPTDAGRRWTERFERALAELRHIPADIAALAGSVQGSVTIGTLPLARYEILPRAIATLLRHHPGLHIRSLESPYEELSAGLMSGRVDFIIGSLRPFDSATFVSMPLFTDQAVLTARVGHPLTKKKQIKLTDLAAYPWVMAHAGTPLRTLLEEFFLAHDVSWPSTAVETGDEALVRGLLGATDMLTVLSAHRLQHEMQSGGLTRLRFDLPGMERTIGVTLRKGAHLSPGATALLEQIEVIAKQLQQAGPSQ